MLDFRNIRHEVLRMAFQGLANALLNGVFSGGGLTQATNPDKFQVAATSYRIAGVNYIKAAADNVATPNGNTAAGQFRKDLISINATGTITVTAGAVAATQALAVVPDCPANNIPLGWIEVPAGFTAGTTACTSAMLFKWPHVVDLCAEVAS